ncbi:MAG: hypothetical protein HY207_04265 [Nitrospirae bacterium]|nr:hypothetical protein [Nitrospirota bacterium]
MDCFGCHIAYPMLNDAGRAYKQDGYRLGTITEKNPRKIEESLILNNEFPFSMRIVGRPYDKMTSGANWKVDALHEADLLIAGNPDSWISAWLDVKAADDTLSAWTPEFAEGMVGFHPSPMLNIQAGYADIFFSDPYDTLTNGGRRMTVSRKMPLEFTVGSNTKRLRDPVQQVNLNGRFLGVYYLAAVAANNGGTQGDEKDKDGMGRLAVEVTSNTHVGGFYYGGKDLIGSTAPLVEDRFRRYGVDLRHDGLFTGTSLLAVNLWSWDDNPNGTGREVTLMAGYVEIVRSLFVGKHTLVPLARYNWAGSHDDQALAESLRAYTLQLGYYLYDNVKSFAEYTAAQSGQSNNNDNRVTVQFDVVF